MVRDEAGIREQSTEVAAAVRSAAGGAVKRCADGAILVIAGHARSLTNFRGPLLRALRDSGYRVIAAAPRLSNDPDAVSELARLGVSCRDISLSRTGLNPFADFRSLVALVRLMRVERPQAVLGYTAKPAIFGVIAAAIARVPRRYALITGLGYAFTAGGGATRALARTFSMRLYRIAFRRATKVFFQNGDDAALFRQLGLLPETLPVVVVNGSGIDLGEFHPAPFPAEPLRFLLIARMLSAKGLREYVAAATIVRKDRSDVEFHLVGGIDSNPDAIPADEVKRWDREGHVVWHGEVSDVRPHIAACHVYVLPSYREGTPRSVLEAMAMGRPIITTDAPGCRETVVEGENGFLVPPRDVDRLVEPMERFIHNPKLVGPMGQRSREIAESKYDVNKVNTHMLHEMELA
jgi:glycosyltransferase involved in cell wall biosynthesis